MKKLTPKQQKFLNGFAIFSIILLVGFGFYLLGIGINKVVYAGKENITNESDNKPTPVDSRTITYTNGKSLLNYVLIDFQTNDVFSVGNRINYTIGVVPNDPDKISDIYVLSVPLDFQFNLTSGADMAIYIEQGIKTGNLLQLNRNADNTFSISNSFTPPSEIQEKFMMFVKGRSSGIEPLQLYPKLDISPATSKLQADTNHEIRNQIKETTRTNDIVEGLTWVIVAWIPLGFAYEIYRLRFDRK
ncbi:MAG: hypothetical protein KGI02_05760 [Thaumarchaeota archaeon]|nr:hypothetical protein [Nitrososphaerota archaeon]